MSDDIVRLKGALAEATKATTEIDVYFLYDSSGSVSLGDFHLAIQAGRTLATRFSDKTAVGFGQFSSQFKNELPFTRDRGLVFQAHSLIARKSGGTATHLALLGALDQFERGARANATRLLFLFTDGLPDDQAKAIDAASRLIQARVRIIGVGIGSVDQLKLTQVCGEQTFILKDWQSLLQAIPTDAFVHGPDEVEGSELVISYDQLEKGIRLKDDLNLRIRVKNVGSEQATVVRGTRCEIEGGPFYEKEVAILPEIPVTGSHSFQVTLNPTGNASIENLPSVIKVSFIHPTTKKRYKTNAEGIIVELKNMIGDLIQFKPPNNVPHAHILLFGWAGAGKSALINSFMFMLNETYDEIAAVLSSADHVTIRNERYIPTIEDVLEMKFVFWDVPGLALDAYLKNEFDLLITGCLPEGYRLRDNRDLKTLVEQNVASADTRRIHSVLFVMPQAATEHEAALERLRGFIKDSATRFGLNPVLVITHGDQLEPSEWETCKTQFHQATGVNMNNIYIVANKADGKRDLAKDRVLYSVLMKALNNSRVFIQRQGKK